MFSEALTRLGHATIQYGEVYMYCKTLAISISTDTMFLTRKMAQFWAICLLLMVSFRSESQSPLEQWDDTFGAVGLTSAGLVVDVLRLGDSLLVAGQFTEIGGIKTTNLALWDGRKWRAFEGVSPGLIRQALPYREGFVVRTLVPRVPGKHLSYWTGSHWEDVPTEFASPHLGADVDAIDVDNHGTVYLAGRFESINGVQAKCIAKWDGTNWYALGSGLSMVLYPDEYFPRTRPKTYADIIDQVLVVNDKVYVAGGFTNAGNAAVTGIACWNEKQWSSLGASELTASEMDYPIFIALSGATRPMTYHSGNLFVAGKFKKHAHDIGRLTIGCWDGNSWSLLPSVANPSCCPVGFISAMASVMGDLYICGTLFDPGFGPRPIPRYLLPVDAKVMARWDGRDWHRVSLVPMGTPAYMLVDQNDLILSSGFSGIGQEDTWQPLKPAKQLALWHVPPALRVQAKEFGTRLSWAIEAKDYALEVTDTLQPPDWQPFSSQGSQEDREMVVTVPPGSRKQFFRLVKHPVLK